MTQAFKNFWTHWADITGNTSRKEFWLTFLDWIIILVIFNFGLYHIGVLNINLEHLSLVMTIASLIIWIPSISLISRRLNDVGISYRKVQILIWIWILLPFLSIVPYIDLLDDIFTAVLLILCMFSTRHF